MIEYTAQTASPLVNGEVRLTISETALTVFALPDIIEVPYAKIKALSLANYVITAKTSDGDYAFSRMGGWTQSFFDALCDAYRKAALRSLFLQGSPLLITSGDCHYTENSTVIRRPATAIHVYENCIATLPPDCSARRVPLCLVNHIHKGDYELTLQLSGISDGHTGDSYTYAKLGYDTAPFADTVEKQIRKLQDKTLAAVKEIDPSLSISQASQLAKLMPEGVAAPLGRLAAAAPSFVAALEEKLSATCAAETYAICQTLCDPAQIFIGFRKNETGRAGNLTEITTDPYIIWFIVPSPDNRYAAVEFAEADTATFVYRTDGDFSGFAQQLNRALEAISFKREVIRLTDTELLKPENADYLMASDRTAALRFIRGHFIGRIIHSGIDTWKSKLTELWRTQ